MPKSVQALAPQPPRRDPQSHAERRYASGVTSDASRAAKAKAAVATQQAVEEGFWGWVTGKGDPPSRGSAEY